MLGEGGEGGGRDLGFFLETQQWPQRCFKDYPNQGRSMRCPMPSLWGQITGQYILVAALKAWYCNFWKIISKDVAYYDKNFGESKHHDIQLTL